MFSFLFCILQDFHLLLSKFLHDHPGGRSLATDPFDLYASKISNPIYSQGPCLRKIGNTQLRFVFLNFSFMCQIASVGLKLDRPQLQQWLLFLEHKRPRSENSNVVAGLPVPMA